jgi:hypothetical protein
MDVRAPGDANTIGPKAESFAFGSARRVLRNVLRSAVRRAQFFKARLRASQCRKKQAVVKQTNPAFFVHWLASR